MNSLKARLLVAATLVLIVFIVVTGVALDRAFHSSAEQAVRDRLQGLIYALLGATDVADDGSVEIADAELADDRLRQPDSGLYQVVFDEQSREQWRSPSLMMKPPSASPAVGEWGFQRLVANEAQAAAFVLAFGVQWAVDETSGRRLTFLAMEDARAFERQVQGFRRTLLIWLVGAAAGLLIIQLLVLTWGIEPIRQFVSELRGIEAGHKEHIEARYPKELEPLANGINALLHHERNQQTRYRHALDDLAHSLKTPLAVIRGLSEQADIDSNERQRLSDQVGHMDQIIGYQLHKASTAGRRALMQPVVVRPACDKIVAALGKVYQDKGIEFHVDIDPGVMFRAEQGDLLELFGNLLENACKFCRRSVAVSGSLMGNRLQLRIDDDGPGFPPGETERILQRGERADTRLEGQGIGLSVVAEVVKAYGGSLKLEGSPAGGGRVLVTLSG